MCAVWLRALTPERRDKTGKRVGRLRKPLHGMASACGKRIQTVCVLLYRPAASVVGRVFLSSVLCSLDFGMHIFFLL